MHMIGGEDGIRTHDNVTAIHTFQACSFDHSDTSPRCYHEKIGGRLRPYYTEKGADI
jgi:hypothetical protein